VPVASGKQAQDLRSKFSDSCVAIVDLNLDGFEMLRSGTILSIGFCVRLMAHAVPSLRVDGPLASLTAQVLSGR
jgi:hypothetical protein